MSRIYFIVTIDTECDKSKDWSVRYPFQFKNILEGIPERLQPLFRKHGIKPTYLLSPEVIADPNSARMFRNLDGEFELGTHLHGEFIEPEADFSAKATYDFQSDYPYNIEFEKISNLTQLFKKTFEYSPVSFRAGRFGIGSNSLLILNKLGYLVDSSIYPFSIIQTKEKSYNFCYYPIQPYFPDLRDPSQTALKESETILEVPLTIRSKFFQSLPSRIGRKISDSSLLTGLLSKVLGKNYVKTFSLRPSTNSYKLLLNIADFHIRNVKSSQDVYLNLMFHSNEIIEGASPYCQTESEIELFLRNLDLFFSQIKKNNIKFIKLKDTYFLFKEQAGENNV